MEKKIIRNGVRPGRGPEPEEMDSIGGGHRLAAQRAGGKIPVGLTDSAEQLPALPNRSGPDTAGAGAASEWIGTRAAAKLTRFSQRSLQALCANGFFVEGREWKQRQRFTSTRQGGWIWIKRSALKKLEGEWAVQTPNNGTKTE